LTREDHFLKLKIRDNGEGFDFEALPPEPSRHPGLTSMKEYTELSEGRFSLRSSKPKGRCIEVTWDLSDQRNFLTL